MAYTQTPQQSTYKTTRFPLMGSMNQRNYLGLKDQRYINCFPESIKNPIDSKVRIYIIKRPGLVIQQTVTPAVARGTFYWNNKIYSVWGNQLYSGTTAIKTLNTSTGNCGFVSVTADVVKLFFCDGTDGYIVTQADVVTQVNVVYPTYIASHAYVLGDRVVPTSTNTLFYEVTTAGTTGVEPVWPTAIGDTISTGTVTFTAQGFYGGFPSPHVPTPVYMDGYVALPIANGDDIYNSGINMPDSWASSDFISAEMYPDITQGLVRQNNQMVAFGAGSIEYFFDAANASGSPFARNDGAAQHMGTPNMATVTAHEKNIYFVSQAEIGGRAVWEIDAFKPTKISLEWVDQLLDAEGTNISAAMSYMVRTNGHQFYVLNLTSRTIVYDVEEKMWHEWSSNSAGVDALFMCNYGADGPGHAYLQHATNGNIYKFDSSVYQDNGVAILMTAITSLIDLDNNNRKTCSIFTLICDHTDVSSLVNISYSDDDYKTWSTPRTMDLIQRPFGTRWGKFRRRAWKVQYTDNLPFRAESYEIETNMGTN